MGGHKRGHKRGYGETNWTATDLEVHVDISALPNGFRVETFPFLTTHAISVFNVLFSCKRKISPYFRTTQKVYCSVSVSKRNMLS